MSSAVEECIPKECKNDLVNRREVYRLMLEKKTDWDFSQELMKMPTGNPEQYSDYISREKLYEKVANYEMLALKELSKTNAVLDDGTTLNPDWLRLITSLNERTALKHMIADF